MKQIVDLILLIYFNYALRIHSDIKVYYDQNFITSRFNKNLKKINHIKEVGNIYFT